MVAIKRSSTSADQDLHRAAFSIPVSHKKIDEINAIKNNAPELEVFNLSWVNDARYFSDSAWELLGRYVAENNILHEVNFSSCAMTNSKMSALFKGLTGSRSLKELDLSENEFGLGGVKAMISFLKECPHLSELDLDGNDEMGTEGFELLAASLHGGAIERLRVERCNVENIMALERYTLPKLRNLDLGDNGFTRIPSFDKFTKLQNLYLDRNDIDQVGYQAVANLLQKKGSSLTLLSLCSTGMRDQEAKIIADSLKSNTELKSLDMRGCNSFSQGGLLSFLKLLNDISSIDNTFNSNNAITNLGLPKLARVDYPQVVRYINFATNMNRMHKGNAAAAGRAKVIGSQLNTRKRIKLYELQGIKYGSTHVFSQIETHLLPNVLALVGMKHGMNELYRMVIATSPDLMSLRDENDGMQVDILG